MSSRLHMKQMLQGMKASIEEDLEKGVKPLEKIKIYNATLQKYKHDFAEEHEKEIEELAQQFGGKIIK